MQDARVILSRSRAHHVDRAIITCMKKQNYVSDELTHFVGRSQPHDEARYALLLKILAEGKLLDISHVGKRHTILTAIGEEQNSGFSKTVTFSSYPSVLHDTDASLADNRLLQFELVCFCDIPLSDVGIHCAKYSYFGLAFRKEFLVSQGAGPVMYVPRAGQMTVRIFGHEKGTDDEVFTEEKSIPREYLYDGLMGRHNQLGLARYEHLQRLAADATNRGDRDGTAAAFQQLQTMLLYQTAIEAFMFGFLKYFDPSLPEDHIDNYYMEREWRVAGQVAFSESDVARVIVPQDYAERARADLPHLASPVFELARAG